ncbi:MAG: DUF1223 domain-containing protein [Rhizobiales bacterium]|nr:DUF1223 domain-containing protein [Hyphomicrobiales bacterium]
MGLRIHKTRREALLLATGACLAGGGIAAAGSAQSRPAVIELFTSQGCSSCPAADAFMEELAAMPDVIALSYNVDYWDYLGWRDTLASAANSQRQYDYAKARGDMDVYTPQIICDGQSHYVGSKRAQILAAIERVRTATPVNWVPMTIERQGDEFLVTAEAAPSGARNGTIWLMSVMPRVKVAVERGENAGKEITYYNVVRNITPGGMWHGERLSLNLPVKGVFKDCCTACVALLQTGDVGPVIGAARWSEVQG